MFRIPVTPEQVIVKMKKDGSETTLADRIKLHQEWLAELDALASATKKTKKELIKDNINQIADSPKRLSWSEFKLRNLKIHSQQLPEKNRLYYNFMDILFGIRIILLIIFAIITGFIILHVYVEYFGIKIFLLCNIGFFIITTIVSFIFNRIIFLPTKLRILIDDFLDLVGGLVSLSVVVSVFFMIKEYLFIYSISLIIILLLSFLDDYRDKRFLFKIMPISIKIEKLDLSYAIITKAVLKNFIFNECNLEGVDFAGTSLKNATFTNVVANYLIFDTKTLKLTSKINGGIVGVNGMILSQDTYPTKAYLLDSKVDPSTERVGNADVASKNLEYARHVFGVYLIFALLVLINIFVYKGWIVVDSHKSSEQILFFGNMMVHLSVELLYYAVGIASAIILFMVSSSVKEAFIIFEHTTKMDEITKITSLPWILTKKADKRTNENDLAKVIKQYSNLFGSFLDNKRTTIYLRYAFIIPYAIILFLALGIKLIFWSSILYLIKMRYWIAAPIVRILMIFCVPFLLAWRLWEKYEFSNFHVTKYSNLLYYDMSFLEYIDDCFGFKLISYIVILIGLFLVCTNLFWETQQFQRPFLYDPDKEKEEKDRKKNAEESLAKIEEHLSGISDWIKDQQNQSKRS